MSDIEDPTSLAAAFEAVFFAQSDEYEDCTHKNITAWADGRGYCTDCGITLLDSTNPESAIEGCMHEHVRKDDNGTVCTQCGQVIDNLDFTQEWRYYGAMDSRSMKDPTRCHSHKSTPKGIKSVFEARGVEVSAALIRCVEGKYTKVLEATGSKVLRGKGREAIVANCLFYAYQENGEYRTSIYIRNLFDLEQKRMSLGATKYYTAFPEDRVKHITPEKLIPWIMKLTGVETKHYRRIISIARYISSASELVERSNPQSVAAAIVYFYLCLNPEYKEKIGATKSAFAKKALLSDLTVGKIVREIENLSRAGLVEMVG